MENIYSPGEAAEILGVSRQRVAMLRKQGILQAQKIGKFWFPLRTSVEAYKGKITERTDRAPKTGNNIPRYLRDKKPFGLKKKATIRP